ncbi:MAG: tRNA (guanosine(46)-N7)-methyltransferase TrmB, partial [Spirochaetales bacterium]|nr:tRNA (guanosine(46)-N7)-methyltransferase TrmB [Spirochaetales bacterium]
VTAGFLSLLASRLGAGGYVYVVTDWEDYAEAVASAGREAWGLVLADAGIGAVPWRPETAFERKALSAGREIREFVFVKARSL